MKTIQMPHADFEVSAMGLGCMGMSEFYGDTDDEQSERSLTHALDLGITMFDTADMYGSGHNEELVGRVLPKSGPACIATKFGIVRDGADSYSRGINNSERYIRDACEASLRRLNRDTIDLYYVHRLDQSSEIEDTIGYLSRLVEEGKIRSIGLCEASAETIERAHRTYPISAIQSEYSLWTRNAEASVLPKCGELGIMFVPYSPLGRGMLTGAISDEGYFGKGDFRPALPRFAPHNLSRNTKLIDALQQFSRELGCSTAALSLAWIYAQEGLMLPIPGSRRIRHLDDNASALNVSLDADIVEKLNTLFDPQNVFGERYSAEGMKGVEM